MSVERWVAMLECLMAGRKGIDLDAYLVDYLGKTMAAVKVASMALTMAAS